MDRGAADKSSSTAPTGIRGVKGEAAEGIHPCLGVCLPDRGIISVGLSHQCVELS